MWVISVWNPWAWALVCGLKGYENRTWNLPARLCGERVLIHCGLHKPTRDELQQVAWAAEQANVDVPAWATKPVGGIVGSLIFDGDVTAEQADNLWATGPRCWRVQAGSAVMLHAAIPCKGLQGFFRPPPEVAIRFSAAPRERAVSPERGKRLRAEAMDRAARIDAGELIDPVVRRGS